MTIPRELREMIYGYVFDCNTNTRKTETKKTQSGDADREDVASCHDSAVVRLHNTAPPTKDPILPCHQLYAEMTEMRSAAHRHY
jgi:hypothetical protein